MGRAPVSHRVPTPWRWLLFIVAVAPWISAAATAAPAGKLVVAWPPCLADQLDLATFVEILRVEARPLGLAALETRELQTDADRADVTLQVSCGDGALAEVRFQMASVKGTVALRDVPPSNRARVLALALAEELARTAKAPGQAEASPPAGAGASLASPPVAPAQTATENENAQPRPERNEAVAAVSTTAPMALEPARWAAAAEAELWKPLTLRGLVGGAGLNLIWRPRALSVATGLALLAGNADSEGVTVLLWRARVSYPLPSMGRFEPRLAIGCDAGQLWVDDAGGTQKKLLIAGSAGLTVRLPLSRDWGFLASTFVTWPLGGSPILALGSGVDRSL